MKIRAIFIASLLFSLCLTGCARNSVNNDKVAYRNNDNVNPARVNYDNRDRTSKVTDINDSNRANNIRDNDGMVRNDLNNGSRMRVADKAAKKIANLPEVNTANVIVTNNNAYVAVKLPSGKNLTDKIEKKISNRVKSVDRNINRVYVSANPDFYKHMQGYANDIRGGKPVSGFFTEFTQTIQRVFPDVK
jgi:spore cortex protein